MQMSIRLPKWMIAVSEWLDDNVFTDRADYLSTHDLSLQERQALAEEDSNKIRKRIESCRSLRESYQIDDLLRKYTATHGRTVQVRAAEDSLRLDLMNKQHEIIDNL